MTHRSPAPHPRRLPNRPAIGRRTAVALLASLALGGAAAQGFPSRPVRIISPAPPGGATDNTLRVLAAELSRTWGQQVLIDSKPGGTGLISQQAVMASPNDGHVLGMQVSGFMTVLPVAHGEKYSNLSGVTPVAFLSEYPLALTAAAGSAWSNWKDLAAQFTRPGGSLQYGTSGVGGTPHLAGELIRRATGIDMVYVPYKGDSPMVTDIAGGQVPVGLPIMASALPQQKGGRVKFLAVLSSARVPFAPDVPTLKEQGVDVVLAPWNFVIGPPGMAPELVARINRDVNAAMRTTALKEFYAANALLSQEMTVEQLRARVKADTEIGQGLIRELKIPVN